MNISDYYKNEKMYFHRNVTNISEAKKFYQEILGLDLIVENMEYKWCNFKLPISGITLSISENHERANKSPSIDGLEISVTDLQKVYHHFQEINENIGEIIDLPGILSMFDVLDPDNNLVTFIGEPRK